MKYCDSYSRILFKSAAIFNFVAGGSFLVAYAQVSKLMGLSPVPTEPLFIHFSAVLVLLFGWAYWCAAIDPQKYRFGIVLGAMGKILVGLVVYGHWFAGNINWPLPALLTVDFTYAALFIRFLKNN